MTALSSALSEERSARWLLLVSLALNLFFVGAAGTLAMRNYLAPAALPATLDRSVAARIDRLAATLPENDAELLRAEFRARTAPVEAAQAVYRQAQDHIRQALRVEPFETDPLRIAMAETRAARQGFDQALQELIAAAAAKMSAAGRAKLADWPPRQPSATAPSR